MEKNIRKQNHNVRKFSRDHAFAIYEWSMSVIIQYKSVHVENILVCYKENLSFWQEDKKYWVRLRQSNKENHLIESWKILKWKDNHKSTNITTSQIHCAALQDQIA